jgi:hypothetical protein
VRTARSTACELRGAGSRAPITSASVQVSVDNGATWQRVPTIGFRGEYVVFWPNKPR